MPYSTQKKQVLNELKTNGFITSWDAIEKFHITRLSQFIYLLRNEGLNIEDVWETDGHKHWKRYLLINREENNVFKVLDNGQYSLI